MKNGTTQSGFFELGEIRPAHDSDFEYFIKLAEGDEGWVQKYDKNGLTVWNKDTKHTSIRMLKVCGRVLIVINNLPR